MKTARFLFVVLSLFLMNSAHATNYYVAYDPACIERYEYAYAETRKGNEIVVYVLKISETERLFLSVGVETTAPIQPYAPGSLLDCNTLRNSQLTRDWFNTVNSKVHQVYIVSSIGANQYRIAQVGTVYYYRTDGREIVANTNNFRFHYTPGNAVLSQGDLSNNDVRGSVYYLKDQPYGNCPGYMFRQTNPSTPNRYLDIYVVPSVGIIEESSSLVNTSFKLRTVNGVDATAYLSQICQGSPAPTTKSNGTNFNNIPNSYNMSSSPNELIARGVPDKALQTHTVAKGETLYKISRQYALSVDQLKTWNRLSSDELRVGTVLYLSPTNGTSSSMTNYNPPVNTNIPNQYSFSSTSLQAWLTTSGTHTVAQGETVSELARQYGYSEERFRYMNNLNAYDNIRPGQLLKTTDCPPPHRVTSDPVQPPYTPNNGTAVPNYNNGYYNNNGNNNQGYNLVAPTYNYNTPAIPTPSSYDYTSTPASIATASQTMDMAPNAPQFTSKGIQEDPFGSYRSEPNYYPAQPSSYEYRNGVSRAEAPRQFHTVRMGETIESIAANYGLTSSYLRNLNNLDRNEGVLNGQQLIIK